MSDEILRKVRQAADKRILFLPHTIQQMSRPDRMITTQEIETVIKRGELIENYPEDIRGQSCLILGYGDKERNIHVVCSPKEDYLVIITAYLPDPNQWSSDFKRRLRK
ncbi:DUF4258 domain-containing protein [Aphanothece sacrum]|uniref:DUF4258 domain-containing protein n=1 Tax=Aphanothece sacrum FPU1 TaxID=1920663 RepID=A0A401ILV6_APHSA|nr:DUF4258 domain-containing protein [Aphanothece sacrum]GBF82221.1 hypothetical protein AsFPU1_3649 [Aphanothece sacrum FPU1]GBF87241.1 hypothetical protein AsFPU3_4323 [Aphanothece sacrum FPU3]